MNKQVDLSKMQGLLASKSASVIPATDALQRGATSTFSANDEKTQSSKDEIVNLSFKVPGEFRKRFKLAAINAGITQNELVMQALGAWERRQA
jgi:hypothetical protein